jgi:hypothetical protein
MYCPYATRIAEAQVQSRRIPCGRRSGSRFPLPVSFPPMLFSRLSGAGSIRGLSTKRRSLTPHTPGHQSRSGRHGEAKILLPPGLEFRPVGRPACNQSLYRLRYTELKPGRKGNAVELKKSIRNIT